MRCNRSSNVDATRVRKISLQNDYAFGIISPVTSCTLPIPILRHGVSEDSQIPCIIPRPWQVERQRFFGKNPGPNDPDLDVAVDPLSDTFGFGPAGAAYSTSSERFRRWSMSNFQSAFKATDPSGTEVSSQFASSEEDFCHLSRENIHDSRTHYLVAGGPGGNWISGLITAIPEKIRKISTERRPVVSSQTNLYSPSEDLKRQLQNVYVY